ncbi:MAG: DUF2911 domain-containing protein [Acidobacteriota bacterium]
MNNKVVTAILLVGFVLGLPAVFSQRGPNTRGETALGEREVVIEYGRPSTHGRDMMAMMRPGSYWRLGADTNTVLETETSLRFGDSPVPAGSYILLAHMLEPGSWQLVVCKSVGDNFTPKETLATVPLTFEDGHPHVEQLTLDLEGSDGPSKLVITWGTYRLTAQFSADGD